MQISLAVRPCLRAFCEERALPSVVEGPLDLAPLMREDSDRVILVGSPVMAGGRRVAGGAARKRRCSLLAERTAPSLAIT